MVELLGLKAKLRTVNASCLLAMALYLYGNPAYSIIYGIMGPYQNYPNWPRTPTYNLFNKAISYLCIKVKHEFAIHKNL